MTAYQRIQQGAAQICQQSGELGQQVPEVMHKRLSLMATQDPIHHAKTRKEIERMVVEKPVAFFESWQAMLTQSLIAQQNVSKLMMDSWVAMAMGRPIMLDQLYYQVNYETLKVFEKGISPIHRRVMANAKRLK